MAGSPLRWQGRRLVGVRGVNDDPFYPRDLTGIVQINRRGDFLRDQLSDQGGERLGIVFRQTDKVVHASHFVQSREKQLLNGPR